MFEPFLGGFVARFEQDLLAPLEEECVKLVSDLLAVVDLQSAEVYDLLEKELLGLRQLQFFDLLQGMIDGLVALEVELVTLLFLNVGELFCRGCLLGEEPLSCPDVGLDLMFFSVLHVF